MTGAQTCALPIYSDEPFFTMAKGLEMTPDNPLTPFEQKEKAAYIKIGRASCRERV